MLKQIHKAPARNTQLSLGFASMLMFGIATMMPAHAPTSKSASRRR